MAMLKFFTDRSFLAPGATPFDMLFPFWGETPEDPRDPCFGRYAKFLETAPEYLALTPLEDAAVLVMPNNWVRGGENREARRLAALADAAGKPLVIFFRGDHDDAVHVANGVVFRTSLYRSTRGPREFALPAWSEDFLERYAGGRLAPRPKAPKPRIGFCGYAAAGPRRRLSPLVAPLGKVRGGARALSRLGFACENAETRLRARVLNLLARSRAVETDFVIRTAFWNGTIRTDPSGLNTDRDFVRMQQSRREYVTNMLGSDYTVCIRGAGNFSFRLYETLSAGRIPVFIDTDCVLPFEEWLDWRRFCVWVPEREIGEVASHVSEFHARLSPAEFEELQRTCRRTWEQWLSPSGFFEKLSLYFGD